MAVFLGIAIFVISILIGVPVAFGLGLAAIAHVVLAARIPLEVVPTVIFGGMDSFPLLAIPFFIMAGDLMERSNVLPRLVHFANSLVGHFRGGLAYVNVLASMLFAGVTGASIADTAAVGSTMIPSMISQGYSRGFSAALTACGSVMGAIIPPSVAMLIVAFLFGSGVSVTTLFLAGAVPGILIGLALMGYVLAVSRFLDLPTSESRFRLRDVFVRFRKALVGLLVPLIILGGILSGVFTATEAGAIAVVYALLAGIVLLRTLTPRMIVESLLTTAKTTSVVFILIGTAKLGAFLLTYYQVPAGLADVTRSVTDSPVGFMIIVVFVFFVLGFVMEGAATMIMLIPIFAPIARQFGVDPHHLGVVIVMTVQVALVTPPVALGLFIVSSFAQCPMERIFVHAWPMIGFIVAIILAVVFVPDLALWLPRALGR